MFGAIWTFLKGKKTVIGTIIHIVTKGLVANGNISPELGATIDNVATGVIVVGLGDKAITAVQESK